MQGILLGTSEVALEKVQGVMRPGDVDQPTVRSEEYRCILGAAIDGFLRGHEVAWVGAEVVLCGSHEEMEELI